MNISRMFTKKPLANIVSLGAKGKLGLVGRNEFPEVYEDDDVGDLIITQWEVTPANEGDPPPIAVTFSEDNLTIISPIVSDVVSEGTVFGTYGLIATGIYPSILDANTLAAVGMEPSLDIDFSKLPVDTVVTLAYYLGIASEAHVDVNDYHGNVSTVAMLQYDYDSSGLVSQQLAFIMNGDATVTDPIVFQTASKFVIGVDTGVNNSGRSRVYLGQDTTDAFLVINNSIVEVEPVPVTDGILVSCTYSINSPTLTSEMLTGVGFISTKVTPVLKVIPSSHDETDYP